MFCHTVGCRLSKAKVGARFRGETDSGKSCDNEGLRENEEVFGESCGQELTFK